MRSHSNTESSVLQYQAGERGPDNRYNRKALTPNEIDSKLQIAEPRHQLQNEDTSYHWWRFTSQQSRGGQGQIERRWRGQENSALSLPAIPGDSPYLPKLNQVELPDTSRAWTLREQFETKLFEQRLLDPSKSQICFESFIFFYACQ